MDTVREGSTGPDVTMLQERLKTLGFPPGAADGVFGPATEAAVMAFQTSEGLLADGIVGNRTWTALGFADDEVPPPPDMPNVTIGVASKMLPSAPLDHIKQNLPLVLHALEDAKLTSVPIVLAALATIRAETAGFMPISEGISRFNTSPGGHPFDLYDNRQDLGNRGPPDGADFRGRGFVQLTGRSNYVHFSQVIGQGDALLRNPEAANEPRIAAQLLAAFIAAKEIAIKNALLRDDLAEARRQVNGGTHGLAEFTAAYRTGQQLLAAPVA